jgi:hypothetical protein
MIFFGELKLSQMASANTDLSSSATSFVSRLLIPGMKNA